MGRKGTGDWALGTGGKAVRQEASRHPGIKENAGDRSEDAPVFLLVGGAAEGEGKAKADPLLALRVRWCDGLRAGQRTKRMHMG
jgi:hypothetical protein